MRETGERPLFLIVVMDGLRPDMITPDLTPHLATFRARGCDFPYSRAVFPSMTRVNATSLATGATVRGHGIVANNFYDPLVFPNQLVHGNRARDIEAGTEAYKQRLVSVPTLGDIVARAGLKVAVVSTGTGGTARLLNPNAGKLGHITLCLRDWGSSLPVDYAADLQMSFGAIPPATRPNSARIRMQTEIFLERVWPEHTPDISILWYSDPDSTHHHCGIGSEEGLESIRNVDGELGRLLDWWSQTGLRDRLQIIVASDHGHLTARRKIPIHEEMLAAGLSCADSFQSGAEYVATFAYTGAVWARDRNRRLVMQLAEWLLDQPWCGMTFTTNGDGVEGCVRGTFDRSLVLADHARGPDIYYIMANDNQYDGHGIAGGCFFADAYPEGGSVHGGLHPKELNNVLMIRGSRFVEGFTSPHHAGITDIAPTIFHLLGLRQPFSGQGRVLREAMDPGAEPATVSSCEHSVKGPTRRQYLRYSRVNDTLYLDSGWVE